MPSTAYRLSFKSKKGGINSMKAKRAKVKGGADAGVIGAVTETPPGDPPGTVGSSSGSGSKAGSEQSVPV
jgi:hypothetical protein